MVLFFSIYKSLWRMTHSYVKNVHFHTNLTPLGQYSSSITSNADIPRMRLESFISSVLWN